MCGAQFVAARVILTAAQCVRDSDSGDFYDNVSFEVPNGGGNPTAYEQDCSATFNGWVQPGDEKWNYDYAMILLTEDSQDGWFGMAWNFPKNVKFGKLGYVGEDGAAKEIKGTAGIKDGFFQMRRPQGDDGPAGGAGWLTVPKDGNDLVQIFTVDSFSYTDQPGITYGPYFDEGVKNMLDYVQGGCQ